MDRLPESASDAAFIDSLQTSLSSRWVQPNLKQWNILCRVVFTTPTIMFNWKTLADSKKYFLCPCVSQISANFISFYLIGPNLISRSVIGWILFGLLRSWRLQWVLCLLFDSKESWTEHERLDYYRCPPSVCSVGDGGYGQDVEVPPPHPGYHCVRAWNVFIIV